MTLEEVIKVVNGKLVASSEVQPQKIWIKNVNTDTRNIQPSDLFVPIIGQRFDGHDFLTEALDKGALAVLSQKTVPLRENDILILVEDTLQALGALAAYYRKKFDIPVVAVTGSVGKTSTKEMIYSVLSQQYKVLKTKGNFNNEIGLPLTLFGLDNSYEAAIIEMGMSGFGEISRLTRIAKPDIAVITNIGVSHIENLGSKNNILKAKMEIVEGLSDDGYLILNGDDKLLYGVKDLTRFYTQFYGMEEEVNFQALGVMSRGEVGSQFDIEVDNQEYQVMVPVPGMHNVYNALAAIAVGLALNVPMDKIVQGIGLYKPEKMRMNIVHAANFRLINDVYNSSPDSVKAAIDVLCDIKGSDRSIAILGDMLEMGQWAESAHKDIGRYVRNKGVDHLITVGFNAKFIAEGALVGGMDGSRVHSFKNNEQVHTFVAGLIENKDILLVKGSRGMKMEEIVDNILAGR